MKRYFKELYSGEQDNDCEVQVLLSPVLDN